MRIAVDTHGSAEYKNFIFETFKKITADHPEHTFIFIFDKSPDSSFIFSENLIAEVVGRSSITLLSQLKFTSILKRYKADVFVTGEAVKSNVPQCLIAFDNITHKSLNQADTVITTSEFYKKELIGKYKADENKIEIVCNGVSDIFQPIAFEERESIKEMYADGNEYFLFTGEMDEKDGLLNLLKAFSIFKKRQKSSMQLMLAFRQSASKEFLQNLQSFRFKDDVKVLQNINEENLPHITASAYVLINPFSYKYFSIPPLEAMKCHVPVITSDKGGLPESCGNAALYTNADDINDIAEKMMLIFKDENLRTDLINKGKEQIKKFSWDRTAKQLWQAIIKTAG